MQFGTNVCLHTCDGGSKFERNPSAGLPENQEKHVFFNPLFQKVGQNKDFSTIFSAVCIDLRK